MFVILDVLYSIVAVVVYIVTYPYSFIRAKIAGRTVLGFWFGLSLLVTGVRSYRYVLKALDSVFKEEGSK